MIRLLGFKTSILANKDLKQESTFFSLKNLYIASILELKWQLSNNNIVVFFIVLCAN